jgi:hypothetical protein
VTVRLQLDLTRAVDGARPRPLDRHAAPTERPLAALMAVAHRPTVRIVLALRADDLIDLGLHEFVQHPRPTPTLSANSPSLAAPASSPSASCTRSGNPPPASSSPTTSSLDTILIAAVPPVLGGLVRTRHARNASGRGGRTAAFKFYELRHDLVDAGIDVYFCDPHAPWQRGANENTNGLLRHYFPKGTDFSTVSETELDAVADELNARPRKRLGFANPTEQLTDLLLQ